MSVAIIGAVVGIGGTAYSIYSQQQAISAANSARPAKFVPVDIAKTARLALDADQAGYKISDFDWERRFPKLKAGRDANIADMANQISGGTSRAVTDAQTQSGLKADLGNTEFEKARNLGLPLLGIEQRDRNYFQKQLGMNPQRTAGLSGQDTARIAVTNTGSQANYNQGIYQSRIAQYNAGIAQTIQNQGAAAMGLGSLADLIPAKNYSSPSLDPAYYGHEAGHAGIAGAGGGLGYG